MMKNWLNKWMLRHKNPTSIAMHIVGIPACFVGAPILLVMHLWYWAIGSFVGGYALQFIGHAIEGNQSGEEILVRKILGKTAPPQSDKP